MQDQVIDEAVVEHVGDLVRQVAEHASERMGRRVSADDVELSMRCARGSVFWVARVPGGRAVGSGPCEALRRILAAA